jgi:multisubunit Na+/H+ antiporter MnhB subunit
MKFWKEHTALRLTLMLITFVLGLFLLIYGWKQTGQLWGLGLMLAVAGVALLLVTLALYNKPFEDPKKR